MKTVLAHSNHPFGKICDNIYHKNQADKINQIKSTRYVPTTIRYSLFSNKGCFKQLSPPDRISLQAPPQTVPSCQASGPGLSGLPGHGRANFTRFFEGAKKMTIMMIMTLFWWKTLMSLCFSKKMCFFWENAIQPFALESCLLHKLLASKHPSASASKGIIFHVSVEVDQHGAHGANERWSLGSWRGSQTRLRWTIGPDQHLFRARLCP